MTRPRLVERLRFYTEYRIMQEAADEIERLRGALEEIRDHWANQYDHPRKEASMYRGFYGIGVTDGHRACATIATNALSPSDRETP